VLIKTAAELENYSKSEEAKLEEYIKSISDAGIKVRRRLLGLRGLTQHGTAWRLKRQSCGLTQHGTAWRLKRQSCGLSSWREGGDACASVG